MTDPHMRIEVVERERAEAWAVAARWRRGYEVLKEIIVAGSGPNPDLDRIDELFRIWAVMGE